MNEGRSMKTAKDLKHHIAQGDLAEVYLFYGTEAFLHKQCLKMLSQKVIPEDKKDFNYHVFYAEDSSPVQVREAVETLPVFCSKRMVVCLNAHLFKDKDWSVLKPVIQNPSSSAILVLTTEELDKRKKISKFLLSNTYAVYNKQLNARELFFWSKGLSDSLGLKLSDKCLDLLIKLAGSGLMSINNELQKIKSYGFNREITEKDILKISPRVRPENIFSFTEAVGKQDLSQSFNCLINLLEDHESEVGILALVSRHIRILSAIKEGMSEGLSPSELSARAGVPSFFLKDYIQQVRLWNDQKMARMQEIIHATDKALKSSPVSSDIWLENFVIKACSL